MPLYRIYAGLGGGYGDAKFICVEEHDKKEDAENSAYLYACDEFECQMGCGMDGWEDFLAEAESDVSQDWYIDDEEGYQEALAEVASQIEAEARESWVDYYTKPAEEGVEYNDGGDPEEEE